VSKGWLYGVNRLKQLSLAYNQVDFIEDDGWEFCTNLWQLDLRGNLIKVVSREILQNLPSLTHLDLGENLISHIEAEGTFVEVPRLRSLTLDGNQISHTIEDTPATFQVLKDLRNLTLASNQIKSMGRNALTGLQNLEYLDLANNVISTLQVLLKSY
jgi:Leucine-rich repeat (LRR) protein